MVKEAVISAGPKVTISDVEIPKAGPNQLVIKVNVSGSNPKDWKYPEFFDANAPPKNQGDDIAGTVHEVGDGAEAYGFKVGDRVAAFHQMLSPNGSYAEYAVAHAHTTFFLPKTTSDEEAATFPLAALTAAVGLYQRLGLPEPWTSTPENPPSAVGPLLIYGGATAVGAFAIKLASRSNIHPIIAVAGRGTDFVETLIDRSKGDTIVDYRGGDEAVVSGVKKALGGKKLLYAFDTVSEKGSYVNIAKALEPNGGKLTTVLPVNEEEAKQKGTFPEGLQRSMTMVGDVHGPFKELGLVYTRYFTRGLAEGWLKGHPFEVVPGGLEGVEDALKNLKEGKASAVKYVFRIADTPGVGA